MHNHVDIWSKGEVVRYLQARLQSGQIMNCLHLSVEEGYFGAFYSDCSKHWASSDDAINVDVDCTAYSGPSSYSWPRCPANCPHFLERVTPIGMETDTSLQVMNLSEYVNKQRIDQLRGISKNPWDTSRLVRTCEELNMCYRSGCYLAVIVLVRSVIDQVPPAFGQKFFSEVVNNYGGSKSFKSAMKNLESVRPIADLYLHEHIRAKEALPTRTQADFSASLDTLLQELIRIVTK